mgnify:CR=1 FL=1
MTQEKLSRLSGQIESMTSMIEQIKSENKFLRNRLSSLVQERAELVERKNKAMSALKRIVKQLKQFKEYQEVEAS